MYVVIVGLCTNILLESLLKCFYEPNLLRDGKKAADTNVLFIKTMIC